MVFGSQGEVIVPNVEGLTVMGLPHASVCVRGDRCFITDLGSVRGTYVGQAMIPVRTEVELIDGDVMSLGNPFISYDVDQGHHITNPMSYVFVAATQILHEKRMCEHRASLTKAYEQLPVSTLAKLPRAQLECSICLACMDAPCVLGGCGHTFCYRCLIQWIRNSRSSGTRGCCPMCRTSFVTRGLGGPALVLHCRATEALFEYLLDPLLSTHVASARKALTADALDKIQKIASDVHKRIFHVKSNLSLSLVNAEQLPLTVPPVVMSSSITTIELCGACSQPIPPQYSRIVCHHDHATPVHFHGSGPCANAVQEEIASSAHNLRPIDAASDQECVAYESMPFLRFSRH